MVKIHKADGVRIFPENVFGLSEVFDDVCLIFHIAQLAFCKLFNNERGIDKEYFSAKYAVIAWNKLFCHALS